MFTRAQHEELRQKAIEYFEKAHIYLTDKEKQQIEIADYGYGYDHFKILGLALFTYINTDRVCAKEIVCFPGQYSPEHYHPDIDGMPGKEELFRCRYGTVYLYVSDGEPTPNPKKSPPPGEEYKFKYRHEIILNPGDQYLMEPGTWHWFTVGPEGAVISEFSTTSRDEFDIFTDKDIIRETIIQDYRPTPPERVRK